MRGWQISALVGAVGVVLAGGGGLYYYTAGEMRALKAEVAHCGEPGCAELADRARRLAAELERLEARSARVNQAEETVRQLKEQLAETNKERDRLADQVAACGEAGCRALRESLDARLDEVATLQDELSGLREKLTARTERVATLQEELAALEEQAPDAEALRGLKARLAEMQDKLAGAQDKLAAAREANDDLRTKLQEEFARQAGQEVGLVELARVNAFDIGSHDLDEARLAELEKTLRPYKDETLLVIGMADKRSFRGPHGGLKQLGLMLARAKVVEEMGYTVYYQVRQKDSLGPEARGIIVYRLAMKETPVADAGKKQTASVPTFFVASGEAGRK